MESITITTSITSITSITNIYIITYIIIIITMTGRLGAVAAQRPSQRGHHDVVHSALHLSTVLDNNNDN